MPFPAGFDALAGFAGSTILGSRGGWIVGVRTTFCEGRAYASIFREHRCAILRNNLSHDLPHSLGQARRGVFSTVAGRLFSKLGNGMT